ncbi:hypothetical protein AALP_AA6G246100 [Arabis alpina]|uniref:Uncharacterized protein n=1 Tax=Arabis alpina TaxID=50452 RepID=A0A087GRG7_ARAAL|nr:hypothetical protein AALP_AA6G246100 [Arabis alpina]
MSPRGRFSHVISRMRSSDDEDPTRGNVTDVSTRGVYSEHVFDIGGTIPLNDEDPELPYGNAFASSSSSSSYSRASSDEDTFDECGISEEIVLVARSLADRTDAPPPGYMTLFENYFDECLLWFPLPRFLMRFLAVHGVCLAQINSRDIKYLLGIYVLSRECGVVINTEHLSYLTDFRVRGRSEELKHTVTNSSRMALITGFPSKDDHFEDRFFFIEISERTVEVDCINLVKTRWERRVKPLLPEVSKEFVTAMHTELSSGNGDWRKSFSQRRIERALSAEIFSETSASPVGGLLRDEAYSALSLFFDCLVCDYDEDIRSRDSKLGTAKEANAALQSRLDELAEQNEVLERDALSMQKVKKDYDDKLTKLKLRCTKAEGEVVELRGELSSAIDLHRSRIDDAVQKDMLNLPQTDANWKFIGLLQGSEPPDLLTEVKALREQRHPIYDAHDVFADLLASVRRVLEIPVVSAGAAEASVAVDDDVEVTGEDDVEVTDDDEDAED